MSVVPPDGITTWVTEDGIRVVRIHYTADPDKNPVTQVGAAWLEQYSKGYIGGTKGTDWKSEMDIDFSIFRGKPVYASFVEEIHVAREPIKPIKQIQMLRGWDMGVSHLTPACAIAQLIPNRFNVFECVHSTGRAGIGITKFGQEVIEHCNLHYPGFKFEDYGDPAAWVRSQTDDHNCAQILETLGIHLSPGEVSSVARDEVMRVQLERMMDGKPFVQVCPTAQFMIQGFKGGFQYKQIGQTEFYTKEHEKNEWSHCHESLQYIASRVFSVTDPQDRKKGRPAKNVGFSNWARKPDSWA